MNINQYGRSMAEMIGVLSIIGIISIGGYNIVGKSIAARRNTQIVVDASMLATTAKKLACQYDEGYTSYTTYLHASEAYPKELEYVDSGDVFEGMNGVTYSFEYVRAASSSEHDYFKMVISNLDDEKCIHVASSDWGTPKSSGFIGLSVGTDDEKGCIIGSDADCEGKSNLAIANTANYPMSKGKATAACSNPTNNQIQLWYRGCH